jgi:methyl-accepting chemotaxis protein
MKLASISIRARLLGAFVIVAIIALLVGTVGALDLRTVGQSVERQYAHIVTPLDNLVRATEEAAKIRISIRETIISKNPTVARELRKKIDTAAGALLEASKELKEQARLHQATDDAYRVYEEVLNGYLPIVSRMQELSRAGRFEEMDRYLWQVCIPQQAKFEPAIVELRSRMMSVAKANLRLSMETARRTQAKQFGLGAVALLVAIAFGYVIATSVAGPIGNAATLMEEIAEGEGDLRQRLPVTGRDEVARLTGAFNRFADRMTTIVLDVRSQAISTRRDASELKSTAETVHDLSGQVGLSMERVAEGSMQGAESTADASRAIAELNDQIANLAKIAGEVNGLTGDASDMIAQMTESIDKGSHHAALAAEAASKAAEDAERGREGVERCGQGMDRIRQTTENASLAIRELGEASGQIGMIVQAIDDIAAQTNLLALNAAIEAARAGEHGKGFAVVAEEVRKLAERSSSQTKEITALIESIQSTTRRVVEAMEAGMHEVQVGNDLVQEAKLTLSDIHESVSGAVGTISAVSAMSLDLERTSSGALEAMRSLRQLAEAAARNAESMERTSDSATARLTELAAISEESAACAQEVSEMVRSQLHNLDRLQEAVVRIQGSSVDLLRAVDRVKTSNSTDEDDQTREAIVTRREWQEPAKSSRKVA